MTPHEAHEGRCISCPDGQTPRPLAADENDYTDTFTYQCVYGCTVHVIKGTEQLHDCEGVALILAAWRTLPGDWTFGQGAQRFADALKPLLRTLWHERSGDKPRIEAEIKAEALRDAADGIHRSGISSNIMPLIQDWLRREADELDPAPVPTRPAEPQGRKAIVTDKDGNAWQRGGEQHDRRHWWVWGSLAQSWDELTDRRGPVTVLSEGWTGDADA